MKSSINSIFGIIILLFSACQPSQKHNVIPPEIYQKLYENNALISQLVHNAEQEFMENHLKEENEISIKNYQFINDKFKFIDELFKNEKPIDLKQFNQFLNKILESVEAYNAKNKYNNNELIIPRLKEKFLVDEINTNYSLEELENDYLRFKFEVYQTLDQSFIKGCNYPVLTMHSKSGNFNEQNTTVDFQFYEAKMPYEQIPKIEIIESSVPLNRVSNNVFKVEKNNEPFIKVKGKTILLDGFGAKRVREFETYIHADVQKAEYR